MQVEIWSDVVCPWCALGRARFLRALEAFEGRDEVEVVWRSFELDPDAAPEYPGSIAEYIARKYGTTVEQIRLRHAQMTEMAAAEGVAFRFDLTRRANSFDAHRLLQLAAEHGRQDALNERLMRAHHGEGELISDHGTLRRLAGEAGLDEDEVADALATDRFAAEVRRDEATAQALGISAVPFFVVDRAFGASGAQDPEVLLQLLRRAAAPAPTR